MTDEEIKEAIYNMSEEEKKAIEYIDKIVSDCENHWKQLGYTCNLYDGDEPIPVDVYKTVLNIIEKQNKEIESLKDFKEIAENKVTDLNPIGLARVNQLLSRQCHNLQETVEKQQTEIEKKEKVIRTMAEAWKQDDIRNVDEIIEEFKKKVETEDK